MKRALPCWLKLMTILSCLHIRMQDACMHAYSHILWYIHAYMYTHIYTNTHTRTYIHTCTHVYTAHKIRASIVHILCARVAHLSQIYIRYSDWYRWKQATRFHGVCGNRGWAEHRRASQCWAAIHWRASPSRVSSKGRSKSDADYDFLRAPSHTIFMCSNFILCVHDDACHRNEMLILFGVITHVRQKRLWEATRNSKLEGVRLRFFLVSRPSFSRVHKKGISLRTWIFEFCP